MYQCGAQTVLQEIAEMNYGPFIEERIEEGILDHRARGHAQA